MATISSLTLRIDGTVAYANNTSGTFEWTWDSRINNNIIESPTTAYADVVNFVMGPNTAHVTAFNYHISGQVAYADNTVSGFDIVLDEHHPNIPLFISGYTTYLDAIAQYPALFSQATADLLAA